MGHIINLTVQAFLFGDDKYDIAPDPTGLESAKWRTKGALGKLHNIIAFVQRSPQRIGEFIEIGFALRPNVRRAIRIFCQKHQSELKAHILDADEWSHVEGVYKILNILEQTTLDAEGSFSTLGKVIITMNFLLKLSEDIRQSKTDEYSEAVKEMCNNAWNKLNIYYNLTETSVVYVAAVVLDPRVKWVYFALQWPDWISQAREDMIAHWKAYYCGSHSNFDTLLEPQRFYQDGQSEVSKFREQNIPQDDEILDEYELYCILAGQTPNSCVAILFRHVDPRVGVEYSMVAYTNRRAVATGGEKTLESWAIGPEKLDYSAWRDELQDVPG